MAEDDRSGRHGLIYFFFFFSFCVALVNLFCAPIESLRKLGSTHLPYLAEYTKPGGHFLEAIIIVS